MKKRILFVLLVIALLAAVAACGGSSSLSGTFTDATGTFSYTFEDGVATMTTAGIPLELGPFEVIDGNIYIAGVQMGIVGSRNSITMSGIPLTRR